MNILFLSESQGWSGGAAQLLLLADGLKAAGHTVTLASPQQGELAQRARNAGLAHVPFHPRQDYDLPSALRLAQLLKSGRFDALHAHHPRAHAVGLVSLYLSSRKPVFVVTRRVSFPIPKNLFSRFKYCNPRIAGFIAVAESVRHELILGGVQEERIATIPSGVDTRAFAPRPKDAAFLRELGLPEGTLLIGKVGNHGEWKGQDLFLEAAAIMARSRPGVSFLLAGRDTDSPALKMRASELGLGPDKARFLGFRADVPRILSVLDVSVNAAKQGEGISGALRESLAMEIPVAASTAGGNAELVKEGVTGRLFQAGSAPELARVLGEMLDHPQEAKAMARCGRQVVRERYSAERMVRDTEAYYRKLLSRRPGAQNLQRLV